MCQDPLAARVSMRNHQGAVVPYGRAYTAANVLLLLVSWYRLLCMFAVMCKNGSCLGIQWTCQVIIALTTGTSHEKIALWIVITCGM